MLHRAVYWDEWKLSLVVAHRLLSRFLSLSQYAVRFIPYHPAKTLTSEITEFELIESVYRFRVLIVVLNEVEIVGGR